MTPVAIVILAVDDVERASAFYRAAFGWRVRAAVPVYVELDTGGGTAVALYLRSGFGANTGAAALASPTTGTTATELYVRVDDLDDAVRRLSAAGARELSAAAPRPWGDTAAYFADPDGNVVAVATVDDEHVIDDQ